MVLICNNKILSIEQWHKNRCKEKNEKLDILTKINYENENLEYKDEPVNNLKFICKISKTRENKGTFVLKTENYDCKK